MLDEKTLDAKAKEADQYEIAFIKGGRREVFQLAFYTLVKSGYLFPLDKEDKTSYPHRRFYLDKQKDLNVLHELEKAVSSSYDKAVLLPDDPKEFEKTIPYLNEYERKVKELALMSPQRYLEPWWIFAWYITLLITPFLYGMYGNFPAYHGALNFFFLAIINVLAFLIIKRIKLSDRLSDNGKKYIELFEKNHFPYPDFRKELSKDYVEMITPCSL